MMVLVQLYYIQLPDTGRNRISSPTLAIQHTLIGLIIFLYKWLHFLFCSISKICFAAPVFLCCRSLFLSATYANRTKLTPRSFTESMQRLVVCLKSIWKLCKAFLFTFRKPNRDKRFTDRFSILY